MEYFPFLALNIYNQVGTEQHKINGKVLIEYYTGSYIERRISWHKLRAYLETTDYLVTHKKKSTIT